MSAAQDRDDAVSERRDTAPVSVRGLRLRNIVRGILQKHPLVLSFHDAPAETGGWGATVLVLPEKN